MTPYKVAMKNGRLLLAPLLDPRLPRPFEKMGKGIRKFVGTAAPMPTEPAEPEPQTPPTGEEEGTVDIDMGMRESLKRQREKQQLVTD